MHTAPSPSSSAEPFDLDSSLAAVPRSLIDGLPRDQALGLRLVALARACAAVHMGEAAKSVSPGSPGMARSGERA